MKTKAVFALVVVVSLIFGSCEEYGDWITPSGNVSQESRTATGFTGLDVSNAMTVYVNFSDTEESIVVEANDNLLPYIITEVRNGILNVKLQDRIHVRWGGATMNVYLTTKYMDNYTASGASNIYLNDPLYEDGVVIDISGACNFEGELEVQDLAADVSGASNLNYQGEAAINTLDLSGASNIRNMN
ncbi:MAG: DUF2807 domain-containing protein [Bacteroidales bacterium]|nr:DUF2807 domain-containing protein [Bacteroidales bacterium]